MPCVAHWRTSGEVGRYNLGRVVHEVGTMLDETDIMDRANAIRAYTHGLVWHQGARS